MQLGLREDAISLIVIWPPSHCFCILRPTFPDYTTTLQWLRGDSLLDISRWLVFTSATPFLQSSDAQQLAKDDTTSPSTSPTTPPLTSVSSHWAAAYLHHIRNAEDYAAGIPYVIQAPSPSPTPSPISCPPVCSASVGNIGGTEPPIKIVISSASECSMEADITDILRHYSRNSAGFVAQNSSWGLQCANFTGSPLGIFVEGCGDYSQWSNEDGDTFNKHLGVVSN